MKQFLLFFIFGFIHLSILQGQNTPSVPVGMNFQAVARDMDGQVKADMPVFLRISLTSADEAPTVFYTEEHSAYTDDLGLFNIIIGQGRSILGNTLLDVPWAKEDVWMRIEMATRGSTQYQLVSNTQMLAVPIALYAEQADQVVDEEVLLRNQSIYWNTSGNKESRPDNHFVGTRDNRDFVIKTSNTERARFTKEGQLRITAGVMDGKRDDESVGSYPVTVEGSDQGIYIEVNESRSTANNFVTFADPSQIWGTIEGQTYLELITSRPYLIQAALYALQVASLTAQYIANYGEGAGLFASIFGAGAGAGSIAEGIAFTAAAISLATQVAAWVAKNATCVGVSFTSGGADYAEYLLRAENCRDIIPAEIVGVNGGIVSLQTEGADHVMVVSSNPIVSGNMPQPEMEPFYERVAFMGQVPVRVVGAVSVGDYILPSGNNDGLGVAVCPEDMLPGDYPHIVGVAWEAFEEAPLNVVNVAVGINSEDLSHRVDLLNKQVDNIMEFLEGQGPLITDPAMLMDRESPSYLSSTFEKLLTDEEFGKVLEDNADALKGIFQRAKTILETQEGFDLSLYPELEEMLDDPIVFLKEIRKIPDYTTQWSYADEHLKKLLKKD
jgi:hypothetical protein